MRLAQQQMRSHAGDAAYSAMVAVHGVPGAPPEMFQRAVDSLRAVRLRPEVQLEEVPAPGRIAPHAIALSADVVTVGRDLEGSGRPDGGAEPQELASGRFVVLHDPAGQESWEGTFRVVSFVRAELEPEMGSDPLLGQVGWTWLLECLDGAQAQGHAHGGTVTRVVSDSYGALEDRPSSVEIEVRASWTPADADLAPHLRGWADLLCTVAGLPPLPEGVAPLPRRLRR
jgi:hypothetical protein